MKGSATASLISIIIGILILIHHLIYTSRLFDIQDILHHEFFAGVLIAFGIGAFLFRPNSSNSLSKGS